MNGDSVLQKLSELQLLWMENARKSVGAAAQACADTARRLAPVGTSTPHLRDTIRAEAPEQAGEILSANVITDSDHAAFVEFGTGRRGAQSGAGESYDMDWAGMAAQPYLQPAADAVKGDFLRKFSEEMQQIP